MSEVPDRRLLLVHAHPDDESINNGATMAKYAAEGAAVTLVTCTLGEEGEVIPPELAELEPPQPPHPPQPAPAPGTLTPLGRHRQGELADAMRALGVTDHRLLGAPGRYRDSGMTGWSTNDRTGSFWSAPLDDAALDLVPVIREVRPQVLVTYDPDGGYGHPDHIKAHRVALRARELAADPALAPEAGPAHRIARVFYTCLPREAVAPGLAALRGGASRFAEVVAEGDLPGFTEDAAEVAAVVDGRAYAQAKTAAMRAHATQIEVDGDFFALSNGQGQPLLSVEYYRAAEGPGDGPPVADLFEGTGV